MYMYSSTRVFTYISHPVHVPTNPESGDCVICRAPTIEAAVHTRGFLFLPGLPLLRSCSDFEIWRIYVLTESKSKRNKRNAALERDRLQQRLYCIVYLVPSSTCRSQPAQPSPAQSRPATVLTSSARDSISYFLFPISYFLTPTPRDGIPTTTTELALPRPSTVYIHIPPPPSTHTAAPASRTHQPDHAMQLIFLPPGLGPNRSGW